MYVPLKVTTDYSILHSLIKIKDLIDFCIQKKISSCAICDTNLFGAIEFYQTCLKNNIKPLIGLDIIVNSNHVYLYAQNYDGYKNLLKINTIINERNISILELQNLSDNILGIIPYKSLKIYDDLTFFKKLYIGYENKEERQNALIKTSNVVYVNDIKMFKLSHKEYLQYLDIINEEEKQEYLHNYFDLENLTDFDLQKMDEVNNLIDLKLDFGKRYIPKYCDNSKEFLTNLCLKGLKKRLNGEVPKRYLERLQHELNVINKMGFVDYFLIVYDYVLYAKKNHILVGPGRGSAAGSLVSFVTGITDIDPLKYDLLFERFLNSERVTMPDIDIDFDSTKRELVINYVKEKYGKLNVSGGITYATFKTRLVLREIGKILKIDESLLNKFLKVVERNSDLKSNLQLKNVNDYLNRYPELKKLYQICLRIEGLKRNISTHAAGIVIADRPLDEIIPMYKNGDVYLTGVTMEHLEDLGLLKMDFLGLKNLNIISNIISKIPNFNLNKIDLEDPQVYKLFCEGDTDGIFQFETPAFKNMLKKYQPHNFQELVASIALVRPGPSAELATYIKRKNGQEKITYYHEDLKSILEETYGVIVYQEQVISILVKMASFTYAEADNIRRAMAKKKTKIIMEAKDKFINRSLQNGYLKELANNIYDHILEFAGYGFNKSHSVAYAIISYQMAYLKVHYKTLFIFELLDSSLGSIDKLKNLIAELKKSGLKINPVNINYSNNEFRIIKQNIYLPFKMIKNLRSDLIQNILEERMKHGNYEDILDFFRRTCSFTNKNEYVLLINAGILKDFKYNTKTIISNLDKFISYGNLFQDLGEYALIPNIEAEKEYDDSILRQNEITSYGMYISNHPASKYLSNDVIKLENISHYLFKNVCLYVMIENIKRIKTKKNEDMAFIMASDETKTGDFTIFPRNYYLTEGLEKNDMIKVWGEVSKRYDHYTIVVSKLKKE